MKIRPLGAEFCMRTEGRTDKRDKANVKKPKLAFRNFAKPPNTADDSVRTPLALPDPGDEGTTVLQTSRWLTI
jgi:hypothetical protein